MAEKETSTNKSDNKNVKSTAKTSTTASKPATTAKTKTTATAKTATAKSAKAETAATEAPKTTSKTEKAASVKTPKTTAQANAAETEANSETAATKPAKSSGGKSGITLTAVQKDRLIFFGIIGLALIMVFCLIMGIVFGSRSCTGVNYVLGQDAINVNPYKQTTMVGYSSEVVGTYDRYRPVSEIRDERERYAFSDALEASIASAGTVRYPKYGYTMSSVIGGDADKVDARNKLIAESSFLTATGTANAGGGGYTWMDENGFLYTGTRQNFTPANYSNGTQRQLYKHTASVGLYLGDVSDDEPGIIKRVILRPRGYTSYSVTGVYAAAGEVIKIELSDADMTATGGITIHIGQALYNGQANNIWTEKGQMQRIPHLLNTMVVNKNTAYFDEETQMWTAYVGSFIGGPIYVRNTSSTVTVTISGGVAYRHFILGYTSPEEFAELSKSSVPYFDLEVWNYGVLHSGPLTYAKTFSYDDLYKAAVLWEKVSLVSNYNGEGANANRGIVFLYDPFVAAGGAVAFPGRNSVNCPMDWMASSLNYTSTVTSGSWGNFHEYNHNFQNYGMGYTGEITNNGLNLVSYSLFTKISSARQLASYGGAGLSGWNCYTSATWVQRQIQTNNINSTSHLAVYANLLHNLGQENFLNARGYFNKAYLDRWANITHLDFSYFDQYSVPPTGSRWYPDETEYPLFVPVASVYQTGRTYNYDGEKRESITMQPYVIPYGVPFTVDLRPYTVNAADQYESGSVLLGIDTYNEFYYKIKGVNADGANGTFVKAGEDGLYTFTPNSEINSGKIYVTLEIYNSADNTRYWNGHELEDVDLILEFQQSHEWNKNVLERTTYYYTADTKYADAREAYENGYAGYESKVDRDHTNPTQNANTDIWYCTDYTISSFPNANPETDIVNENSIDELRGKLYIVENGKYRIYLRGRRNCALYYSLDGGQTYNLGVYIDNDTSDSAGFVDGKYFDLELEADSWVYIKEVLINMKIDNNRAAYIGVGILQWTVPQYTTTTDDDGNTHYWYNNKEVSAEDASNVDPIAPTIDLKHPPYATAYRCDYDFVKEFESDYFITRSYNYDYTDNLWQNETQTVVSTNYASNVSWNWSLYPTENLVDGNLNTIIHTNRAASVENPFEFVIDMGEEKPVNRMDIYTQNRGGNGDWLAPKDFILEGSLDGIEFFTVGEFTDVPRSGTLITVSFEEQTFRYYRLTITRTDRLLTISEIRMWRIHEILGGSLFSPDSDMFTYKGNWKVEYCNANFGHVLVGKEATVEFKFDGTQFGILASKYFGQNYEIYVDGEIVETEPVKEDDGDFALVFLSPEFEDGKHSVVIYCPDGGNIDSFVIW